MTARLTGGLENIPLPNSPGVRFVDWVADFPVEVSWKGLVDMLLTGLVVGFLIPSSTEGSDSALDEFRETVENGGGNGSWGEENINSLLRIGPSLGDTSSSFLELGEGLAFDIIIELCSELPRSSSCRLSSSNGRSLLSVVEVEDIRSCS